MAKTRKCKYCKSKNEKFIVIGIYAFCSYDCATKYAMDKLKANKDKEAKKKHSERKKEFKLNDRSLRLKEAQKAFNSFIRDRDSGDSCISCGRNTGCKMNAGHYKSVGSSPELRFNELNCHLQCEHCNSYKSGNIELYRPNLIKKIGLDKVEFIEGPHKAKKYTCQELKEIELKYKKKLSDLI